jgi:hypothetical protein
VSTFESQIKAATKLVASYGMERISDAEGAPTRRAAAPEAMAALRAVLDRCGQQAALPSDFIVQLITLHIEGKY